LKVKPVSTLDVEPILDDFEYKDHEVLGPILRNAKEAEGNLAK
jgi:hypothetical protein